MRTPRWVVLSPHLDDAALSAGGLIAALRSVASVEVWTIFCGATFLGPYSDLARWLHAASGGSTGSRLSWRRRKEDRAACRRLGAEPRHFRWKDAPYRTSDDGDFLYETCQQATWHPHDNRMIATVTAEVQRGLRDSDVVLAPLAIGGHVDHMITRKVAELLKMPSVMYYPEVPYLETFEEEMKPKTDGLCTLEYTLMAPEIEDWISAVTCYVSQMRMLEEAAGSMPDMIRRYVNSPGLRLYRQCDLVPPDSPKFRVFRTGAAHSA